MPTRPTNTEFLTGVAGLVDFEGMDAEGIHAVIFRMWVWGELKVLKAARVVPKGYGGLSDSTWLFSSSHAEEE